MNKTRADFISDMLAHQNINVSEKERLFELAKEEIKKLDNDEDKLRELTRRIEKLEKENKEIEKVNTTSIKKVKGNIGKPKDVANFMSLFNQRNGLKYLTHDFDEEGSFEIDDFLKSSQELFNTTTNSQLSIPNSLYAIVQQFAFNTNQIKWLSISEDYKRNEVVNLGWSSEELRGWSKHERLHPIRNDKYKKIINDFRRVTRIESPNLESLIESTLDSIFENKKIDFDIEKIDLTKADFYTHVRDLKKALELVFKEILKRSNNDSLKKIQIKYQRETIGDYFIRKIIITHFNSFPPKELDVLLKEWSTLEKGTMGDIANALQGYCNWSVVTSIEEKPVRINILKDIDTPSCESVDASEAIGFTHVFTFFYK